VQEKEDLEDQRAEQRELKRKVARQAQKVDAPLLLKDDSSKKLARAR